MKFSLLGTATLAFTSAAQALGTNSQAKALIIAPNQEKLSKNTIMFGQHAVNQQDQAYMENILERACNSEDLEEDKVKNKVFNLP